MNDFITIVKNNYVELAKLLIDAGVNINTKDNNGKTTFQYLVNFKSSFLEKLNFDKTYLSNPLQYYEGGHPNIRLYPRKKRTRKMQNTSKNSIRHN